MRQAVDLRGASVATVAVTLPSAPLTSPSAPVAAQRLATAARHAAPAAATSAMPFVDGHGSPGRVQRTVGADPSPAHEDLSTSAVLDRVDEMMGQLEERILEELERRGGRFMGYF